MKNSLSKTLLRSLQAEQRRTPIAPNMRDSCDSQIAFRRCQLGKRDVIQTRLRAFQHLIRARPLAEAKSRLDCVATTRNGKPRPDRGARWQMSLFLMEPTNTFLAHSQPRTAALGGGGGTSGEGVQLAARLNDVIVSFRSGLMLLRNNGHDCWRTMGEAVLGSRDIASSF